MVAAFDSSILGAHRIRGEAGDTTPGWCAFALELRESETYCWMSEVIAPDRAVVCKGGEGIRRADHLCEACASDGKGGELPEHIQGGGGRG